MATSFKADISETEHFFRIFYYVFEIDLKYGVFRKKKDKSHSLSITEIINCGTGSYLSVQIAMFHARILPISC